MFDFLFDFLEHADLFDYLFDLFLDYFLVFWENTEITIVGCIWGLKPGLAVHLNQHVQCVTPRHPLNES